MEVVGSDMITDLIGKLKELLGRWHVPQDWVNNLSALFMLAALAILAVASFWIAKFMITRIMHRFFMRTSSKWDDMLLEHKTFSALAHLLPILVMYLLFPYAFIDFPGFLPYLETFLECYLVIVLIRAFIAFLKGTEAFLSYSQMLADKPIASYFQLARIILYISGAILLLSLLLGKSPLYLLGAFGAMTAIILLIFKDTILGVVASVQISSNDMIRVGDWVEMPKFNADGDVLAINLNTVKIMNWDKTISTVPTYYFITDSFKNWRGMYESGGRRIKRAININIASIKFVDPELREKFKTFQLIHDYVTTRQAEIEAYNEEHRMNSEVLINGRRMTNIGVFRKYAESYLQNHPSIRQDMSLIVRQLTPSQYGLPIEIYCFTNTVQWNEYENIQSDIFDHLLASIRYFELEIFQSPAGADVLRTGPAKAL